VNVYPSIEAERAEQHHVKPACELLKVSRAAFYQWAKHVLSGRERTDQALAPRIKEIHTASRGTYGAPRVHAALRRDGIATSARRVAETRMPSLSSSPRIRM
jgi:putative transposase